MSKWFFYELCILLWQSQRKHGPLARYVQLWVAHAPGMPFTFSTPPWVSDPDIHYGTYVTHLPWWMLRSLISDFLRNRWRENVPGTPGSCTTRHFTYLARGPYGHTVRTLQTVLKGLHLVTFPLPIHSSLISSHVNMARHSDQFQRDLWEMRSRAHICPL